ncbi:hypothetical protein [Thermocatellispora tengchongensis]|uniref:hypothetical protein n=1 Tax=Thermocatellispora tengchongensis TaxID=1073253 RepID=UPI0036383BBC
MQSCQGGRVARVAASCSRGSVTWCSIGRNGSSEGSCPSVRSSSRANSYASGANSRGPSSSRFSYVAWAMTWFFRPGRVRVTQRMETSQLASPATCLALRWSTSRICRCTPISGERQLNWIWVIRGGRLSAVALAAPRTASLSDHRPVRGNMFSLAYFVEVSIRPSASSAPGERTLLWAPIPEPASGSPVIHGGASSRCASKHWKVKTTDQYRQFVMSHSAVFSNSG